MCVAASAENFLRKFSLLTNCKATTKATTTTWGKASPTPPHT